VQPAESRFHDQRPEPAQCRKRRIQKTLFTCFGIGLRFKSRDLNGEMSKNVAVIVDINQNGRGKRGRQKLVLLSNLSPCVIPRAVVNLPRENRGRNYCNQRKSNNEQTKYRRRRSGITRTGSSAEVFGGPSLATRATFDRMPDSFHKRHIFEALISQHFFICVLCAREHTHKYPSPTVINESNTLLCQ